MADLTITATGVLPGVGCIQREGTAGATITAGQALYVDAADGNSLKLADCDGATALRTFVGIALNGAADGQPVKYVHRGLVTIGATVAPGVGYYLSATAGGIAVIGDLSTGDYPTLIGFGVNTTQINVSPVAAGVALG